mgnify:CR=1 FL=1
MASKSIEQLAQEIVALSLIDAAGLVKHIEEMTGVTAAMPVAAAAPAAAAPAAAAAEEKAAYKVTLKESGEKIKAIKALRTVIPSLNLTDAKKLVEETPSVVAESAPKEEAQKIKKALEEAGAKVELS